MCMLGIKLQSSGGTASTLNLRVISLTSVLGFLILKWWESPSRLCREKVLFIPQFPVFFSSSFFPSFLSFHLTHYPQFASLPPPAPPPPPFPIHSAERVKSPMRSQGRTKSLPTASELYPTIGNGLWKASSCIRDKSWSHYQGSHKQTKLSCLSLLLNAHFET